MTYWCGLFLTILMLAGISHHIKRLLSYTGTDDYRLKTFLMQHTGSRVCYLSLRKWCFGHFRPGCCLIFQPVGNFSNITLQISVRAMMRCHSNHWQECLLTSPPPSPYVLVFYPGSILKIFYVDSDW